MFFASRSPFVYPVSLDSIASLRSRLLGGLAIPAHPLALDAQRRLDERRQRALTRYYHAAGAGGLAVGVHTTQFAIRRKGVDLLAPVLELAAETANECDQVTGRTTVLIAGICGPTSQAVAEARLAQDFGHDAGLLSLAGIDADIPALLDHCRAVAEVIPVVGFYLQEAVGGRRLSQEFWEAFASIENVVAVKIAPFNRYATLDVIRGVASSGRTSEVALYTGNDDNIVVDLLTKWSVATAEAPVQMSIVGGLLGHWACWTHRAVELHQTCRELSSADQLPASILSLAAEVTDCNAAFFDAANAFRGCIAGIHEVLRRQGLLENLVLLDPNESLSPSQSLEITRVINAHPHLNDDSFVRTHLDKWLH